MALINCPECGTSVSKQAEKCPSCAHPIKKPNEGCFLQTLNFGCMIVFAIIAVLVIFFVMIAIFN